MPKPIRYAVWGLLVLAVAGAATGYWLYNKPHADLSEQTAAHTLSATELFTQYETDEAAANAAYLNQLIELSGKVAEKKSTDNGGRVLLLEAEGAMFGVNCAFQPEASAALSAVEPGQTVTLKGICTGMLMDVSLSRCVLVRDETI